MSAARRPLPLVLVVALLLLSGCRTYGGYGTEAATYNQMQQANQQYATELERARADLERLESAAASNAALAPLAERFRNAMAEHEERLNQHRSFTESMSADSGYRDLHQAYGTITTDMRMTNKRYTRIVQRVAATVSGEPMDEPYRARSTYFTAPLEYAQMDNADRVTLRQALQGQ